MGKNAASCLKLGLRDEIDSVKEAKISLLFSTLECETTGNRYGTPNPANRHDLPSPGRSFAPTNGTRRPAGREHEISQQSEQVIPRTDIPSPDGLTDQSVAPTCTHTRADATPRLECKVRSATYGRWRWCGANEQTRATSRAPHDVRLHGYMTNAARRAAAGSAFCL